MDTLTSLEKENKELISQDQRQLLVEQVRRWSGLNTDAVLDANCRIFSFPAIDGFIGYRIEKNCAVILGDPVCAEKDKLKLAEAFQEYCQEAHLGIVYVIASEFFTQLLSKQKKRVVIQIGNTLVLDPNDHLLERTGSKAILIRKKVKHALHDGVIIQEYLGSDIDIENRMEEIGQTWLKSRRGPQVYIAHLDFFHDRLGKRWFYAKQNNRIVGFLILNEIQVTGWLLNNLILAPDAPSGTSELLVTSVLEAVRNEENKKVIIGPVVAIKLNRIEGVSTFSSGIIRTIFRAARFLFQLDGQRIFWEKFQPQLEPSCVVFDRLNWRSVTALLRALNVKTGL